MVLSDFIGMEVVNECFGALSQTRLQLPKNIDKLQELWTTLQPYATQAHFDTCRDIITSFLHDC
jgi:hypothetical protein